MMTPEEKHFFEQTLLSLGNDLSILEWGSGGSTRYFTQFLRERGIRFRWVSLEYDAAWYEEVREWVEGHDDTEVVLIPTDPAIARNKEVTMDEYVTYPATLKTQFDLIFVDGRKRRRCVLAARDLVSSRGVVVLHDTQRPYYQCAWGSYPRWRVVSGRVWVGWPQAGSIMQRIADTLVSMRYRMGWRVRALRHKLLGQ